MNSSLVIPMALLGAALISAAALGPAHAQQAPVAQAAPETAAAAPETIDVWPGLAPGEQTKDTGKITGGPNDRHVTDITQPQLAIFRASGAGPHPAVMVCPGGGYQYLTTTKEGTDVAQWLNTLGFTAAVLYYRVPNNRLGAYQDGQRALSVLRSRATEFGIDPARLGVLGFSAGGHLAARLAVNAGPRSYPAVDADDTASCRPDFAVLVYPAYLIDKATGQPAPEVAPHAGMPPMFLTQTRDDPYLDAPAYAAALRQAGVPTTAMIYDKGGHGYGLRLPATDAAHEWPAEAAAWLEKQAGIKPE
jgi:acetyl esterase/lipase